VVVLQTQRLAAPQELEETCGRVREYFGDCRIVVVAGAATAMFVERLGCAEHVVRMSRWSGRRTRALVRRLSRRGATDTCIVYDSASWPGPARLELLALAMRTPLCYRALGGGVRPLSRARLWSRFVAGIVLALLAAAAGAAAAMMVAVGLLASWPLLARPHQRAIRRRRRIREWNDEWLRRL
jgi:hypothetical protein